MISMAVAENRKPAAGVQGGGSVTHPKASAKGLEQVSFRTEWQEQMGQAGRQQVGAEDEGERQECPVAGSPEKQKVTAVDRTDSTPSEGSQGAATVSHAGSKAAHAAKNGTAAAVVSSKGTVKQAGPDAEVQDGVPPSTLGTAGCGAGGVVAPMLLPVLSDGAGASPVAAGVKGKPAAVKAVAGAVGAGETFSKVALPVAGGALEHVESFERGADAVPEMQKTLLPDAASAGVGIVPVEHGIARMAPVPLAGAAAHGSVAEASGARVETAYAAEQAIAEPVVFASQAGALELGLHSGTHGWVKVRAELDSATGEVSATVLAGSSHAATSLDHALPAMSAFLDGERVALRSITVLQAAGDAAMGARSGSAGGGEAGERSSGAQGGSRNEEAQEDGSLAMLMPTAGGFGGGRSGGWLSVLA